MIHIRVPATTANMGPGFDSIGMAFQLYNHIWVEEAEAGLSITSKNNPDVPANKSNLIYRSMQAFYEHAGAKPRCPGLRIVQEDNIPMTRGLGSSAACVVAGLMAANALSGLNLPRGELADMAAAIEGHPDNSTPAIIGGMTVGAMNGRLEFAKLNLEPLLAKGVRFGAMIPEFHLSTEKARDVLPESYSRADVVFNASRAALMTAAVLTGDTGLLMTAMDDRVHQPYRAAIIPNMSSIFGKARELDALGVFLSGAGPTLICIYDNDETPRGLSAYLGGLPGGWALRELLPDIGGALAERF